MTLSNLWNFHAFIKKKNDFTLQNVEEVLELKTWWAALAILPFSRRLTLFVCNYTEIKPNTITLFSFIFRLISALFFVQGQYIFLVIGAIIFEISYGLDCVDGSVARLKNLTSNVGAFFDHITDTLGICINLFALALGNNILLSPVVLVTVSLYLFIYSFIIWLL